MAQTKKPVKQGSNLKSFYVGLAAVAIVGIAILAFIVMRKKTDKTAYEPVAVAGAEDPQKLVQEAKGVSIGNDNAPVKMLVFSDYQCPYCGQFASMIEPALTSEFAESGKMQFVYYDFPLGGGHKYSFLAARAARCAGDQNKFWEYHNMLFGRQTDWAEDENLPMAKLLGYGKDVGLDGAKFEACVKSDKYADIVSANHTLGERLGVNATPTIFVNGRRLSPDMGLDLQGLRDLINKEAGGAPAAAPSTPPTTTTTE